MKFLLYLSDFIVPFVIFYIVGFGILMKTNVYEHFIKGARKGFFTVIKIMPTLIGLMVAVGVLRASGFLDFLRKWSVGLWYISDFRYSSYRLRSSGCFLPQQLQGWYWTSLRNMEQIRTLGLWHLS